MLKREIEYMNRQYRGYAKAQDDNAELGNYEMAGFWLYKAQMVRDIASGLGYRWRKDGFVPREEGR